ncbi:hypothetical protein MKW94_023989 [Papaver nudicaule]|uniref:DUF642 domain-containing protein n=1 Tax=Papaver nudicaule TaxID=74823 RepID=A0AA41VN06_PAPNU|nr:hypothetical protein [Papaver nudicaule]
MGMWKTGAARLLLLQLLIASAFAAGLRNPDFEIPPTNMPKNSTNASIPLNSTINTIPGWSYQGTVKYVISSGQGGNAIYLGQNGKINQTFKAMQEFDQNYDFILSLNLKPAQPNCTSPTSVTVSLPNRSVVVSFDKKFGNQSGWQSHACYLGVYGNEELIDLALENRSTNTTKCDVVLDSFTFRLIPNPVSYDTYNWPVGGNMQAKPRVNEVLNGGFEVGPASPNNSSGGILMHAESNPALSPLNQWAILGTVKYIPPNKNYGDQEGNAAIELVSGKSSGVETTVALQKGCEYNLEVSIGDTNDSCVGNFKVAVKAGSTVQALDIERKIRGVGFGFSVPTGWTIKADSNVTCISIRSLASTKTKDQVLCGPVIDKISIILLVASYGLKLQIGVLFVGIGFLVTLAQIIG